MPSPYTSELSRRCARELAKNLAIQFDEIPIAEIFNSYKTALSHLFSGLKENETEENLQARIRAASSWPVKQVQCPAANYRQ
jgi:NAD+ synthase (glutamine-hydrolysing)